MDRDRDRGGAVDGAPSRAESEPGLRYGTRAGRWVLFATVLGSAMAFVDATVVNVALPSIGRTFGAGAAELQWIVNGYTLVLTALLLLGGSLGDRFGRRRVFVIGVAWFATASLLCGLAPDPTALIAARALQGVGGALLTPGSLAILEASFRQEDRGRAIGAWSGLGGVAGALGPLLGGWLVGVATWRLVFLVNLPLAVLIVSVALRHVPESRDPGAPRRLDLLGVTTAALGLGGLTYGFTAWTARGLRSPAVAIALGAGLVGLAGFALAERRSPAPMLPLRVFTSRTFTVANLATFAMYAALGGVVFLLVQELQVVAGFGPVAAGTALLPVTAVMLLFSARAGALAQRTGPRLPMSLGPAVCAAALLVLSRLGPRASYARDVLPGALLLGAGLALTVAPLTATVLGSVEDRLAGVASAVNNAMARAAGLMAVAVLPLAGGLGTGSLTDPAALGPVYHNAMLICAGLLATAGAISLLLLPGASSPGRAGARPPGRAGYHCAVSGPPFEPRRAGGG